MLCAVCELRERNRHQFEQTACLCGEQHCKHVFLCACGAGQVRGVWMVCLDPEKDKVKKKFRKRRRRRKVLESI